MLCLAAGPQPEQLLYTGMLMAVTTATCPSLMSLAELHLLMLNSKHALHGPAKAAVMHTCVEGLSKCDPPQTDGPRADVLHRSSCLRVSTVHARP